MSEASVSPAVSVWEFSSIVDGIHAADAIAKGSPVSHLLTGTTHPGRYIVLVAGDVASVVVARDIVADLGIVTVDDRFLPDIAPSVVSAVTTDATAAHAKGDAIGVVETASVASIIDAADAAVKAANVVLSGLRMADGIGGKAYLVVDGTVGEVAAAVEAATDRAGGQLLASIVIPQLTDELRGDLAASASFIERVRSRGGADS
ncbi:MAG: BMC domain-containing protein [Acidimicrobiia bacterium]